jgi:hypothetical protein
MFDPAIVGDADHAMRNWTYRTEAGSEGRVRIGSEAHRRMFCRMLLDTHNPYKPAVIAGRRSRPMH